MDENTAIPTGRGKYVGRKSRDSVEPLCSIPLYNEREGLDSTQS